MQNERDGMRRERRSEVRGRAQSWLALALTACAGLTGCKSEERLEHERLAKILEAPMRPLCRLHSKEAGGCIADCPIWNSAEEGRAAVEASALLVKIGASTDAETEALLDAARKAAEDVRPGLQGACTERIDRNAELTASVRACARAANENRAVISKLTAVATALAARVSAQGSVKVPHPYRCSD